MVLLSDIGTSTEKNRNAYNANRNALGEILEFLESRVEGDEWYCPKILASKECLNLPGGTVRASLKKLLKEGKVLCDERGKFHFYASAKRMSGDFNRLLKMHTTGFRWQIHGLTMKISANDVGLESFQTVMRNTLPLGGKASFPQLTSLLRDHFGIKDKGYTTFQLSAETLVVWCGCTLEPMDYDRFVLWLTRVDAWLEMRGLTQVRNNLLKWKVVQYGINHDFVNVDQSDVCVTLKAFDGFIARVYGKPALGEKVVRLEAHSRDEKSLEAMLGLVAGGMSMAHTQGALGLVASEMQNNNLTLRDTNRLIVKLVQRMDSQESENKRLRAELDEERKSRRQESQAMLRAISAVAEKASKLGAS